MRTHKKFQNVDAIICQYVLWWTSCFSYTYLQEQVTGISCKGFASPSRNSDETEKEKKKTFQKN